jgi:prophage regulatory protein
MPKKPLHYDADSEIVRGEHVRYVTGLSSPTILRYRQRGDFPRAIKLGPHAVGFRRRELEAWLESRREKY